jgi:hypothetical protein
MGKTSFLFLTLFLVGILTSCHKEPAKTIVFGDTKGMNVTAINTVVNLGEKKELDIDADGTADLEFYSYFDGPLAVGDLQTLYLNCLNPNIGLLGENLERESYLHRDVYYDIYEGDTMHVINLSVFNTCEKTAEDDEVQTYHQFLPFANDNNDSFSIDDAFLSNDVVLFRENSNAIGQSYIYDCDNFPTEIETYIGFKITKGDTPYLGWLKIQLIPVGSFFPTVKVKIIETAIQE